MKCMVSLRQLACGHGVRYSQVTADMVKDNVAVCYTPPGPASDVPGAYGLWKLGERGA